MTGLGFWDRAVVNHLRVIFIFLLASAVNSMPKTGGAHLFIVVGFVEVEAEHPLYPESGRFHTTGVANRAAK